MIRTCFGDLKQNLSICPIDSFARQAHELIKHSTLLLNFHGNFCDTCVVVLIASQFLIGIIEHTLHRQRKLWMKYPSVVSPKVNVIGARIRIILVTLVSFKVVIWKTFALDKQKRGRPLRGDPLSA